MDSSNDQLKDLEDKVNNTFNEYNKFRTANIRNLTEGVGRIIANYCDEHKISFDDLLKTSPNLTQTFEKIEKNYGSGILEQTKENAKQGDPEVDEENIKTPEAIKNEALKEKKHTFLTSFKKAIMPTKQDAPKNDDEGKQRVRPGKK